MGQFSWLYADTKKQMINGRRADSYLLVPPEFEEEYGSYIHEDFYNGYGNMGRYDVYELVALWNKKYIDINDTFTELKTPVKSDFLGLYDFEKEKMRSAGKSEDEILQIHNERINSRYEDAVIAYKRLKTMLEDFINEVPNEQMMQNYGRDYLRRIGILIACYDKDNMKLKYPIKITTKVLPYDEVDYSLGDPDQGWETEESSEDDEDWF